MEWWGKRTVKSGVVPVISLLTDFGLMDPYVAEMKAIILSICPSARIVDISHLVEKFNVRMGAFLLASTAPSFSPNAVHLAVVDPGVGSARRPITVETERSLFVGPDNGLLVPAAQQEKILHVYEVTNRTMMRENVSATFHGRDIFASIAAHLASGSSPKELGPEITNYMIPPYAQPKLDGKTVLCEISYVDGFGNIITNLRSEQISEFNINVSKRLIISVGKKRFSVRYVKTYSDLGENDFGLLVGSHGFLEIACREKSAAKRFAARNGMRVRVSNA
jgi:S-adenosylmethionine hydrolase